MALKLYNESDIQDIADAIRGKNGSSDTYKVSEMADAIDDIPTGGGGLSLTDVLNRSVTGDIDITVTNSFSPDGDHLNAYNSLFKDCAISTLTVRGLEFIPERFAEQTGLGSNGRNSVLTEVFMPDAEVPGVSSFYNAKALTKASFPALTTGRVNNVSRGTSMFMNCSSLVNVNMGDLDRICSGMFQGCTSLQSLDLKAPNYIESNSFKDAWALATLVIRSSSVPTLNNINAFSNTPFASGKSGGTLYVPQSLISSYQSETNWSTILGYATNSIQAIEGSPYETQYAYGEPVT